MSFRAIYQQETRLSLRNRATHLCKCNNVADLKARPPVGVYHAESGRSALKGVAINIGEPPKLRSLGTPFSWNGKRGYPEIHASPSHLLRRQ